jgi:hypothetical protein
MRAPVERGESLLWGEPWPADVSRALIDALNALAPPRHLRDGERL